MLPEPSVDRIRALAAFAASAGLVRARISEPAFEVEVRRAATALTAPAPLAPTTAHIEEPPVLAEVRSDAVGIVRLGRNATAGQRLEGDVEMAAIETLGLRSPIRSQGAGRIRAVCVKDGAPVEYGQLLFTIER